jgi:hypothetical protein
LAQVFDRDLGGTNNWGEFDRLSAFDGSNGDKFGGSADIDGATIVIGAAVDDGSGSAYLFELQPSSGIPDYLHISNETLSSTEVYEACIEITAGPTCVLTSSAQVIFRAPSIVLDSGFDVGSGASFTADSSLPAGCTARPD